MREENTNYVQIGKTQRCGGCEPDKFPDCKELEKEINGYKCDCICHDLLTNANPQA